MPDVVGTWGFWFTVGAVVVVVAAGLLITILLVARGIEKEARRALDAARRIEENTLPIWALGGARDTLKAIRSHVESVEGKAGILARTVHGTGGSTQEVER